MIAPKEFVEQMADVVKATSDDVLCKIQKVDNLIKCINYQYGPAEEIKETLQQQDLSPTDRYLKYPLIVLITPFVEEMGSAGGYYSKIINPRIGIAYHTEQDLKAQERYDKVFKKILLPIYDSFIENLVNSGYIVASTERDLKITRMIRDDIGRKPFLNIDGMTSDYIDAIEITNSQLVRDYGECKTC